jgi:hypothetical protein
LCSIIASAIEPGRNPSLQERKDIILLHDFTNVSEKPKVFFMGGNKHHFAMIGTGLMRNNSRKYCPCS